MTLRHAFLLIALGVQVSSSSAHDLFPNGPVKFRSLLSEPLVSAKWVARGEQCQHRSSGRILGQYGKYNKMHPSSSQLYQQERHLLEHRLQVRLTDRSGLAKE